jgi:hypothetical protein
MSTTQKILRRAEIPGNRHPQLDKVRYVLRVHEGCTCRLCFLRNALLLCYELDTLIANVFPRRKNVDAVFFRFREDLTQRLLQICDYLDNSLQIFKKGTSEIRVSEHEVTDVLLSSSQQQLRSNIAELTVEKGEQFRAPGHLPGVRFQSEPRHVQLHVARAGSQNASRATQLAWSVSRNVYGHVENAFDSCRCIGFRGRARRS